MTWPTSTRGRLLLVVALAAAAGLFLATVPLHRDWFDLGVYYGAVDSWRHGGRIYDYLVPGTHYGFTYPPFAAVCMLPMTLVDWPSAVAISVLLNLAAAAVILCWSAVAVVRRQGWSRWFAFAVAGCLFALLEPVRDTFSFGQVNLLLLALVLSDAWLLSVAGERFTEHGDGGRLTGYGRSGRFTGVGRLAGVGIGLAAAIKLTPAVFIGYLLVTRRWRAAGTAAAVATGATLLAVWAAPGASRVYWTEAMWDTDRVGSLAYVSNQSWQGVLARLGTRGPQPYGVGARRDRAPVRLGMAGAPGCRGRRRAGGLRADRPRSLSHQPGHLGPPSGLAAPGPRRADRLRTPRGAGRSETPPAADMGRRDLRRAVQQRRLAVELGRHGCRRLPGQQHVHLDLARPAARPPRTGSCDGSGRPPTASP